MACSVPSTQAQTIISNAFVFNFPTTGPTENGGQPFLNEYGGDWTYWYSVPKPGNQPVAVDPTTGTASPIAGANTSTNGSLMVVSPLGSSAPGGTQDLFFGTFANSGSYNFNTEADLADYQSISFDILVAPGTPLSGSGDYGPIGVGIISSSYGYNPIGAPRIPGTASTAWTHMVVPITAVQKTTLGNVPGICLDLNSYGYDAVLGENYPLFTTTNWIANIALDPNPPATYPNYTNETFQFDSTNSILGIEGGQGKAWYGDTNYVAWSTNDSQGNANSGSLYISAQVGGNNNAVVLGIPFDTNWANFEIDTNYVINANQYTAIELDVMWDTNNSTMGIDAFNAAGDIKGFPIGAIDNNYAVQDEICGPSTTYIPDAASNGWVHIVCPITNIKPADQNMIGVWLKKYFPPGPLLTAAFWVDNITFDGAVIPTHPNQATLSISEPTPGLQCNFTGNAGNGNYDREMIATANASYSFVDNPGATYSMTIASVPSANAGSALIMFDPNLTINSGTAHEADWVEPDLLRIAIQPATGGSSVTMQAKTNAANANGDLYDGSDPTWTMPVSPVGTWSFTFTSDTNILCTAPNGSSTNLAFPLGFQIADVQNNFGTQSGAAGMFVYFGAEAGGTPGSRWVISAASISGNGVSPLSEDFLAEAQTGSSANGGAAGPAGSGGNALPGQSQSWTSPVSGVSWTDTSDSSTAEGLYLLGSNTKYFVSWTANAGAGLSVLTNTTLNPSGWGTNATLTGNAYLEATYFETEVDVTNTVPGGDLFFSLDGSN